MTAPPDDAAGPADATPADLPVPVHGPAPDNDPALLAADAPVGGAPVAVQTWFDAIAAAARPENDGSLAAAHSSARAPIAAAPRRTTPAPPTASTVRAWCDQHGVPALPATNHDIAAFLATERDHGKAGNTLKLPTAAIRFLPRAAGLPSPTDSAEVSETKAGIRRDAPNPQKKRAATLSVLQDLLAPIPDDPRGLRDRAVPSSSAGPGGQRQLA